MVFIQKKSQAKRVYAEILAVNSNHDGYKTDGFTHPGWPTQRDLMLGSMKRAQITGKDFAYFEAHGTGTQAGDKTELRSIYEAICRDRDPGQSLLIGSIKSITGHAEGASGLVSLAKIIIAYQTKLLAPNLFFENPNPNIPQLVDGTYTVKTETSFFEGGICGINNFGIGGGNSNLIIKSYDDKKSTDEDFKICDPVARLVLIFGRTESTVAETLAEIEYALPRITRGYLSLLNDIANIDPRKGMKTRGYLIIDKFNRIVAKHYQKAICNETNERQPVWFVFNGLGTQWTSMAAELMPIKAFQESIFRSIKYLTGLGADNDGLRSYLYLQNKPASDDALQRSPSVVTIVIMQIALYETLTHLGVECDQIVGYSVGEIAAAYADGCITRNEALRIAFVLEQEVKRMHKSILGKMLHVDMSYESALKHRFSSVDIACINSPKSVTLAGTADDMDKLIPRLQDQQISYQPVACDQTMLHIHFVQSSFGRLMLRALKPVVVRSQPRTGKFVSCFDMKACTMDISNEDRERMYQSPDAEYFGYVLMSPVQLKSALKQAPKNAVFVEIGSNVQLKPFIQETLGNDPITCHTLISSKNMSNNENGFLNSLGLLYSAGQSVELNRVYGQVEYPVARNTEFLSPIFRYDYSKPRFVTKYPEYFCPSAMNRSRYSETVSLSDPNYAYFSDHSVEGLVLYPGTGYLYLAWKAIANYHEQPDILKFPIEFKQINIQRATKISTASTVLKCTYFHPTGSFVIESNNSVCATGSVFALSKEFTFLEPATDQIKNDSSVLTLDKRTLYRELRVRGYHFGKTFQNVMQINDESTCATIQWTNNMITFMDAVLQSSIFQQKLRLLYVPTLIESMQIDPILMQKKLRFCNKLKVKVADVYLDHRTKLIHTAGVQVLNASFKPLPRRLNETGSAELVVESQELLGYDEDNAIDRETRDVVSAYIQQCQALVSTGKPAQLDDTEIKSQKSGIKMLINHHLQKLPIDASISQLSRELENDLIHSTLTSDRFFRTQLDVVIENINLYSKFNVLEINSSSQIIYDKLTQIICRPLFGFAPNNLIYTLAHSNPSILPNNIANNPLITLKKFELAKSRIMYREMEPNEFVIYRDPRISLNQIDVRVDYDCILRSIQMALAENGFLLAFLRESVHHLEKQFTKHTSETFKFEVEQFIKFAEDAGLEYVGKKSDTFSCCSILFRKVEQVEHNERIIEIFNEDLNWLEILKQANADPLITRIWIHSCEPHSGIVGLIRGLAKDISRNKIKYIFYDDKEITLEKALSICRQTQLLQNAFIKNKLGSYRHVTFCESPDMIDNVTDFELRQMKAGDLASFKPFVKQPMSSVGIEVDEAPEQLGPLEGDDKSLKILVNIDKTSLNFRDVMIASARMAASDVSDHMTWDDVVLGLEFAGTISGTGQRVMGFNNSRALAVSILANREFLWPIPDGWTTVQASTVPVVYSTCYYALIIRAKILPGESILIHAGTGGVGLAAINICLALGCKVLVTAGTEEKRKFLMETYPKIGAECIGNSRDCSFHKMVMQQTDGKGVDIVLNSLTDEMFWTSVRCLADNGRFCEIGKYQFMNNDLMGSYKNDFWSNMLCLIFCKLQTRNFC